MVRVGDLLGLLEGINDIDTTSPTEQRLTNACRTLIGTAHSAGVAVHGGTTVPQAATAGAAAETTRDAVGNRLRTSAAMADAVGLGALRPRT
ncbi:hypothetical protein [Streptomyces achromogenes]|uniref:hypothetical protein n=1 Tax=Streptomyces achromogenes TaxID=67255 RepID=UPI0036CCB1B6